MYIVPKYTLFRNGQIRSGRVFAKNLFLRYNGLSNYREVAP